MRLRSMIIAGGTVVLACSCGSSSHSGSASSTTTAVSSTTAALSTTSSPGPATGAAAALARFVHATRPGAVVQSRPIPYDGGYVAIIGLEPNARSRAIVVVTIAGDTAKQVARLELPAPYLDFATGRTIRSADLTGDGRADALVAFAAANNAPGVVVSADGGTWRLVPASDNADDVYVGRDAKIAGNQLESTRNDCEPDCAHGHNTTVVWHYDREHGRFTDG